LRKNEVAPWSREGKRPEEERPHPARLEGDGALGYARRMLGFLVVGVLAAPEVSSAVTVGLGAATTVPGGNAGLSPTVAAQVNVTQRLPVGEARLRLAPVLVPTFSAGAVGVSLQDLGTRLEVEVPVSDEVSVGARVDPFNSMLRRVSFDWANVVGRPVLDVSGFNPVVAADVRGQKWSAFLAARLSVRNDLLSGLSVLRADALGGGEVRLGATTLEARVARFDFGPSQLLALQGVRSQAFSLMGTGRVTWSWHGEVGVPLDLVTYRDDPLRFERFFGPVRAVSEGVALNVSAEGGGGTQVLQAPEVFQAMRGQPFGYGDVQVRVQAGMTRLFATGRLSSLSFVVHDLVGFPPFFALGTGATATPSWSAFLGADHSFAGGRVTPGVLVRVLQPATLTAAQLNFGGGSPPPGFGSGRTIALDPTGTITVLPTGGSVSPRVLGMVTLRYVPFDAFSLVGEFSVERDGNAGVEAFAVRGQVLAQLRL
jgi:hypothetical protein